MKIISISGPAGAGKDTSALIIKKLLGWDKVNICSFAYKLKSVCQKVFGLNDRETWGDLKDAPFKELVLFSSIDAREILRQYEMLDKFLEADTKMWSHTPRFFKTPREIFQYIGSEFLRSFDDRVHLKSLPLVLSKVNIIPDTRFDNELVFLMRMATTYWYCVEKNFLPFYISRGCAPGVPKHQSEQLESNHFPFEVVDNSGSIEELEGRLAHIVTPWVKR